jgi:choice-of-anchor C domain-containing protein
MIGLISGRLIDMKKVIVIGIVLLLTFVGTVSAAVNLVSNPGFETPTAVNPSFDTFSSGSLSLTGWSIDSGSIDLVKGDWIPAGGSQCIDLTGYSPGTISQIIPTVPGTVYQLSFAMAGNPGGNPVKHLEVYWDTTSLGTYDFDTTGLSGSNMGWITITIPNLVASSSNTKITFEDHSLSNPTWYGVALDNIEVVGSTQPINTPEFPSLALPVTMIIGILGAVLLIQRTKEQ